MFSTLGADAPKKKPPRSMGLLLFLSVMMVIASLLLVHDLRTGPNPFHGYVEAMVPRPERQDGPVEVIFLNEEDPPEAAPSGRAGAGDAAGSEGD